MLLEISDVLSLVPVSRSRLYEIMNDPQIQFPRPIKVGRRVFWDNVEILGWVDELKAQRAPVEVTAPTA